MCEARSLRASQTNVSKGARKGGANEPEKHQLFLWTPPTYPHPTTSTFEIKATRFPHPHTMVWQKDRMTESKKACLGKPPERVGSYRLNTEGQQPSLPTVATGLLMGEGEISQ